MVTSVDQHHSKRVFFAILFFTLRWIILCVKIGERTSFLQNTQCSIHNKWMSLTDLVSRLLASTSTCSVINISIVAFMNHKTPLERTNNEKKIIKKNFEICLSGRQKKNSSFTPVNRFGTVDCSPTRIRTISLQKRVRRHFSTLFFEKKTLRMVTMIKKKAEETKLQQNFTHFLCMPNKQKNWFVFRRRHSVE